MNNPKFSGTTTYCVRNGKKGPLWVDMRRKTDLSRSMPGISEATSAIIPIRYIWSAIDSGSLTSLLTQPALFVVCFELGNKCKPRFHPFPAEQHEITRIYVPFNHNPMLPPPSNSSRSLILIFSTETEISHEHFIALELGWKMIKKKRNSLKTMRREEILQRKCWDFPHSSSCRAALNP